MWPAEMTSTGTGWVTPPQSEPPPKGGGTGPNPVGTTGSVREGSCPIQRNTGLQCLRLRPPADVWPLERSVGHLSNPLLDQGQRPELRLAIGLGDVADRLRDHCMDGG